jgi:hypothetical protein
MPKYKAIVTLESGERHVVYQEANSAEEAIRLLSAKYHQDVRATADAEAPAQQSNGAEILPLGDEIEFLASSNNAQNRSGEHPITTWHEAALLIVVGAIMFVVLLIVVIAMRIT